MSATTIVEDSWLAGVCGHSVFKVDVDPGDADLETKVAAHSASRARAFYYAKVAPDAVLALKRLGRAGFYSVDVNLVFAAVPAAVVAPGRTTAVIVEPARPEMREATLAVAETCFRYSRFHLDPAFPRSVANRVKREWIANYFAGQRGDRLFVASAHGRPVGFLAALITERDGLRIAVIDLIGVASDCQGRGVGSALVAAFACHYGERWERFEVGTQLANLPSVALYQKAGFALARGLFVLHMHRGT